MPSSDLAADVATAALSDDADLYTQLLKATGEESSSLYSTEARIVRGRQILAAVLRRSRTEVCNAYRAARGDTGEIVEVSVAVAAAMAASGAGGAIPVAPLAVLAVRHGLDTFCEQA